MNQHNVEALQDISFNIRKPELTTVVGPSGSGKSTLLHILGGLDRFDTGQAIVDGFDLGVLDEKGLANYRNSHVGFIFQTFYVIPHYTVFENIAVPLKVTGVSREGVKTKITEVLEEVSLDGLEERLPNQLSGGQLQRLVIARALVNNPKIILADEPTGNLDSTTGRKIIELLRSIQEKKDAHVMVITHDEYIADLGDSTIHILDGKIHEKR
jgi:ABC-type lipoprotein export system ATPase subunit